MPVTIIAVGNGGYNLAEDLLRAEVFPDGRFEVCDTEESALELHSCIADECFLLKETSVNYGDILRNATDTIILCSSLGGRTGSKYAPLIAQKARHEGKFVCVLCSLPYSWEGGKNRIAEEALMSLLQFSDLLIQQNNDQLKEVDSLGLFDLNKPLVETLQSALSHKRLDDLIKEMDNKVFQSYVPKIYRLEGQPLIKIFKKTIN